MRSESQPDLSRRVRYTSLSRSQKARSERIEYIAINTVAFNNVSGGTLRRPLVAYISSNTASSSASTASTTTRILRIG
jgi:hypothetical protein